MKITKKKIHGVEARKVMMEGINSAADVIGSTMSGKGRNVIIDREYGSPMVINDGVTVLNEVFFGDNLKDSAVALLKDAANRTNQVAGDGTSGTVVLAREIIKHGWKMIEEGANPVLLRKQLERACARIEENLIAIASKVEKEEQAIQIASVSVQDEEVGGQIGKLMFEVGEGGAVAIKNSIKRGVFVEKDAGMRIQGQLTGGAVEREDKWETKLTDAKVLILKDSPEDNEFESKWMPFLRQLIDGQPMPDGKMKITAVNVPVLLVIAEKLSKRFIMMMNQNLAHIKWVWFRPSTADKNMKEVYKDLQSIIGGKMIDEEEGVHLSTYKIDSLGSSESAIINRHELIVTVGEERTGSDDYLDRMNVVKEQVENAEDEVEQLQIKERLANLTGGVAAIKVSAATEQDTIELKLRIEDAINATRVSMEEGYVAGGGVALYNAAKADGTDGEKVLKKACGAVIKQIFYNAGYEEINRLVEGLEEGQGINVLTDAIVDMKVAGIIDPLKVVRSALINAVSVAGLLLTSEYVITNEEDDMAAVKNFFTKKD